MNVFKRMMCIILAMASIATLCACSMPMKIVGNIPDPRNTVTSFFDNVCAGNFKESDKYLSGVSLSMKSDVEGVFSQKLYDYLLKSYGYQINGDITTDQLDAACKVDFTYLDFNLLSDDLKKTATRLGKKYMAENTEGYVEEKEDGVSLTDEGAEKTAADALDLLMSSPEKYYATKTFDLNLKYSGNKWLIYMTEELFDAISGGFDAEN